MGARQNYQMETENAVNEQINTELSAMYTYMSLGCYFDCDDVALPKASAYFKKSANEEKLHAEKFMDYQNDSSGRVRFHKISTSALALEKSVNQSLLDLHKIASCQKDVHLCDFLEANFLDEQVQANKILAGHITHLKRLGTGVGEYLFGLK